MSIEESIRSMFLHPSVRHPPVAVALDPQCVPSASEEALCRTKELNVDHSRRLRRSKSSQDRNVQLRVYDISKGRARKWSPWLLGRSNIEGIWHTGVVVYGWEYFYGGCGVEKMRPDAVLNELAMTLEETIAVGETQLAQSQFEGWVVSMKSFFEAEHYDLITWNCNSFTDCILRKLTPHTQALPTYVTDIIQNVRKSVRGRAIIKMLQSVGNLMDPAYAPGEQCQCRDCQSTTPLNKVASIVDADDLYLIRQTKERFRICDHEKNAFNDPLRSPPTNRGTDSHRGWCAIVHESFSCEDSESDVYIKLDTGFRGDAMLHTSPSLNRLSSVRVPDPSLISTPSSDLQSSLKPSIHKIQTNEDIGELSCLSSRILSREDQLQIPSSHDARSALMTHPPYGIVSSTATHNDHAVVMNAANVLPNPEISIQRGKVIRSLKENVNDFVQRWSSQRPTSNTELPQTPQVSTAHLPMVAPLVPGSPIAPLTAPFTPPMPPSLLYSYTNSLKTSLTVPIPWESGQGSMHSFVRYEPEDISTST